VWKKTLDHRSSTGAQPVIARAVEALLDEPAAFYLVFGGCKSVKSLAVETLAGSSYRR
jgi:hypothetical protein